MLQVESCIELYCYAGLSSKQMPRGTTRSPPASGATRGSPARQASCPALLPKPGNAPPDNNHLWFTPLSVSLAPPTS